MDISNEFQETYNEVLFRKADILRLPLMGTFELTPICNMSCQMCYIQQDKKMVDKKGGLKSIGFWDNVFDQAIDAGMLFCLLTGGEIFAYPNFRELYEKLCRKAIHIVFNTNGTLLDRETVSWLAKIPPRRLNISLYGASNDTYARLCNKPDGFDRVIRAFELLNEYGIQFRVHGVLVPTNVGDYEGIKEICNRFKVPLELSYYMFPPIRKEKGMVKPNERFMPKEMAEVALKYRKDRCGGEGELWDKYVEEQCTFFEHPELRKTFNINKITCRSGCSAFWVNWKGEVSGCGMGDGNTYTLEKMMFRDAWERIVKYTGDVRVSDTCAVCRYKEICPVCAEAAFCETGEIDGTPEYLCEFSREFAELLKKEKERVR